MTVGKANQAAEAARRAELARQAAEAARQRAEAARQAAEQQKAAVRQARQEVKEAPKAEADRAEGLLKQARGEQRQADQAADRLEGRAEAKDQTADTAEARATEVARSEIAAIREDAKQAESPQDVRRLAERSEALSGAIGDHPDLQAEAGRANKLHERFTRAAEALDTVESLEAGMNGTPEERAATAARVLADPAVQESLEGLGALKGSPLFEQTRQDLKAVSKEATPAKLAEAIEQNPDLTQYPPEFASHVATLREGLTQSLGTLEGPEAKQAEQALDALGGALDQAAGALLDRPGGLTLDEVKANPGLGQVLAGAQDPAVQARVQEAVKGWAKESLLRHLDGKVGEDGVEEAVAGFQEEMKGLIESTALSQETHLVAALQEGAAGLEADSEVSDRIKNVAEDNGGGVGGFLKDVADKGVSLLGKASAALGKAIDGFGDLTGGLMNGAIDLVGKFNPVNLGLQGLAGGLDAVGLDGAADVASKGSELVEEGFDRAGDAAETLNGIQTDVIQGFRAGATGLVGGTISSIAHPMDTLNGIKAMAKDPGAAAKALWAEATKEGGLAGAVGYVAANALPAVLSGGSSLAGTGAALTANVGGKLGTIGKLGRLGTRLDVGAIRLERLSTKLDGAYGHLTAVRSLATSANRQRLVPDQHRLATTDRGGAGLADEGRGLKDAPELVRQGRVRDLLQRAENLYVEGYLNLGTRVIQPLGVVALPASAKELIASTANARAVNDAAQAEALRQSAFQFPG